MDIHTYTWMNTKYSQGSDYIPTLMGVLLIQPLGPGFYNRWENI